MALKVAKKYTYTGEVLYVCWRSTYTGEVLYVYGRPILRNFTYTGEVFYVYGRFTYTGEVFYVYWRFTYTGVLRILALQGGVEGGGQFGSGGKMMESIVVGRVG